VTAVSFTTLARPNPDGVLLIEIPARVVAALGDRVAAKLAPGKRAHVTLEADTAARTVALPSDFARALASAKQRPAFDALSFTHRSEHVEGVTGAKRPETRVARIAKVVTSLRAQ